MKLEQMKIKKRLRTGFGFVTLLAMLSAVVGIIALIVVSTRYEYALSHYGFSGGCRQSNGKLCGGKKCSPCCCGI